MPFQSRSRIRILVSLFLTSCFLSAQAAVPSSTYVGQGTSPDPNDNITVSINVPNDNSNSLFYHFSAPAGQTWAAFGFGSGMAGALIFVTYASEGGNNVTVSPRLGKGHVMPLHTSDVQLEVLSGSGIVDGSFVVNAKCSNCRSWDGGNIDVNSDNQAMIWAAGSGGSLSSNDVNAQIQKHEGYNFFNLNLKQATGIGGVPVVSASSDTVIGGGPVGGDFRGAPGFHAFLMVAAFLIVFPGGYLFLRVFEKVWLHWGIQSLALLMTILGMGVGIAISKRDKISPNLTAGHQILGFVVVGLGLATWIVGFVGHRIYKRTKQPAKIMKGHRVLGPATITLGLANCIVGFRFAENTRATIVFAIAMVLMLIFVGTVMFFKRRQQQRKGPMNTPAAANFREGQSERSNYTGEAPLPLYGQGGIPLQSYANNQAPPVYR
ncbi:uncharacterized protein A1O5_10160 [Cladophialophora psammophila CBS 110553]|uniref:DOMON domain-containing protein n=1 Tax=Cladophialophora psammophila CBS 110553 TaxID=1182543 RepID=W9WPA9_9EURO|nr:uncharacterized protein A1O5_10160 [Cladophialophora psammophila CBS 110553]EXJ66491.1 hypothetical protein A1O5_10160 [Cladophialophora psammophila CBS 110553]